MFVKFVQYGINFRVREGMSDFRKVYKQRP